MAKLLIVDDDKNIRSHLCTFFETCGHQVRAAESAAQALGLIADEGNFDLVLSDYRMAEVNGLELLQLIKCDHPQLPVILMTAYATVENAVTAMKSGAYDYVTKPFSLDQIQHVVARALEVQSLRAEVHLLRGAIDEQPLLESRSPAMRHLLEVARQAAASEATILLMGESGTGKNVLAKQIHHWSQRKQGPSSSSTAPRSRRTCWKANCSDTCVVPSRALSRTNPDAWRRRIAVPSSSTKSPT